MARPNWYTNGGIAISGFAADKPSATNIAAAAPSEIPKKLIFPIAKPTAMMRKSVSSGCWARKVSTLRHPFPRELTDIIVGVTIDGYDQTCVSESLHKIAAPFGNDDGVLNFGI